MTTDFLKSSNLPKLTYNELEADYITGTSRYTRLRARKRGELRCVETSGRSIRYTLEMLTDWVNLRRTRRPRKRKRQKDNGSNP